MDADGLDPDITHEEARRAADEYRRALHDYTQLMRHRLANPLTAITAGITTLLELDLAERVRRELLTMMGDKAEELRQVILRPDIASPEERGLQPVPQVPVRIARELEVLAGQTESDFRSLNLFMVDQLDVDVPRAAEIEFLCECSAIHCTDSIRMTLPQYFAVHEDPIQFSILPLHNLPEVEDVVQKTDGFWVVRKRELAADVARAADAR